METKISKSIILGSDLHYSLLNFIKDDNEKLPIKEWVEKYRNKIPAYNIIWLLFRKKFLSNKNLRLFSVWCTREALKLLKDPNIIIINACDIAEKYANGQATKKELIIAHNAVASYAYHDAIDDSSVAFAATYTSYPDVPRASSAAYASARMAFYTIANIATIATAQMAYYTASTAQLDQLLTYIK